VRAASALVPTPGVFRKGVEKSLDAARMECVRHRTRAACVRALPQAPTAGRGVDSQPRVNLRPTRSHPPSGSDRRTPRSAADLRVCRYLLYRPRSGSRSRPDASLVAIRRAETEAGY